MWHGKIALRDRPLENLLGGSRGLGGGGGASEVQKNIHARENSMKKISCMPIKPVKGRAQKNVKTKLYILMYTLGREKERRWLKTDRHSIKVLEEWLVINTPLNFMWA